MTTVRAAIKAAAIGTSPVFLTGTPTQAGTSIFTALVNDQLGAILGRIKNTVCPEPSAQPFICDTALLEGERNTPYSDFIAINGGTAPYTVNLVSGTLPAGLNLNADGTIIGTPTPAATTSSFTVQVTDATSNSSSKQLSLTIVNPISIIPKQRIAKVGTPYSARFQARGGLGPIAWSSSPQVSA